MKQSFSGVHPIKNNNVLLRVQITTPFSGKTLPLVAVACNDGQHIHLGTHQKLGLRLRGILSREMDFMKLISATSPLTVTHYDL